MPDINEMFVAGIALDPRSGQPIVVLNDSGMTRALPIWIGAAEANAIARALNGIKVERPMSHDLMLNMIEGLNYKVKHIEINDTVSNVYLATIALILIVPDTGEEVVKPIDARPSDAIALALRAKAPIYVSAKIIAENTVPMQVEGREDAEDDEFKKFLRGLKASDFKLPKEQFGEESSPEEGLGGEGSKEGESDKDSPDSPN